MVLDFIMAALFSDLLASERDTLSRSSMENVIRIYIYRYVRHQIICDEHKEIVDISNKKNIGLNFCLLQALLFI